MLHIASLVGLAHHGHEAFVGSLQSHITGGQIERLQMVADHGRLIQVTTSSTVKEHESVGCTLNALKA